MAKMTRVEYVHSKRPAPIKYVSFGGIADGIKAGDITVYYEDGRILIDDNEVDDYFRKKIEAKLASLGPAFKIA